MIKKLLFMLGAGFVAKKLSDRRGSNPSVSAMDRKMHRKDMPGGVRP